MSANVVETNGVSDDGPPSIPYRPPDIEQDVNEMQRRKRVETIMNSQVFREELERIIDSQLNEGYMPSSLSALHQVTELLLPQSARHSTTSRLAQHAATPINDIRGVDAFRYAKGEKSLRCKVAAVYRLVDLYGWSAGIYNHITVRLSQDTEHFLLNPFGLQYHEVTASSLLKVDMQGNIIDPGSTSLSFNKAGFVLHSAIHAARPDIKAIIHIHHAPCVAVSAMKCGLLMASQEAAIVGDISYHDYKGLIVDLEERELIARNLGPFNKVLILRNHGVVTCGESIEEALYLMHNLVAACESQIRLMHVGLENIQLLSDEAVKQVRQIVKNAGTQVQGRPEMEGDKSGGGSEGDKKETTRKWKIWDLEFEAQMRMLDNAGYRSGYLYRQPLLRTDVQRTKYDVEIPPTTTSGAISFDEDKWLSPLKKLVDGRKTQDKLRWVNSPNQYQRVEIEETGTTDPKKITKWVQDGSPQHGNNSVRIDSAHQFVPLTPTDPTEFRKKQKEMKSVRLQNKISSGPQSNILEGVTWEEVRRVGGGDVVDGTTRTTTEHIVMVGAASKGIIQRDYQHNATVYKSAYAKNPFEGVTDEEIEEYKRYVEKKQRGEPVDELPEHMRHLVLEPVAHRGVSSPTSGHPKSPLQSPTSDEEGRSGKVVNGSKKSKTTTSSSKEPKILVTSPSASRYSRSSSVHRSHSARMAAQESRTEPTLSESQKDEKHPTDKKKKKAIEDTYFARKFRSERRPKNKNKRDTATANGEESKTGHPDTSSRSSKEDLSTSEKSKKKKGFRTPSFLKSSKSKDKEDKKKKDGKKKKEKEHPQAS